MLAISVLIGLVWMVSVVILHNRSLRSAHVERNATVINLKDQMNELYHTIGVLQTDLTTARQQLELMKQKQFAALDRVDQLTKDARQRYMGLITEVEHSRALELQIATADETIALLLADLMERK